MPRVIFADNDIILKLAEYDLLHDACSLLDVESTKVFVLDSAKYVYADLKKKLQKGERVKPSFQGLDRAIDFVEAAAQITDKADIDWVEDHDNIDVGEAQLASWTVEAGGETCLLTSDKRFLKALAQANAGEHIFRGLHGRVICLEEVIKALIAELGFDHVRRRVASAPECDTGVQLVFGSKFDLPEEQVMEGFESMLGDVASVIGNDWLTRLD